MSLSDLAGILTVPASEPDLTLGAGLDTIRAGFGHDRVFLSDDEQEWRDQDREARAAAGELRRIMRDRGPVEPAVSECCGTFLPGGNVHAPCSSCGQRPFHGGPHRQGLLTGDPERKRRQRADRKRNRSKYGGNLR